MRKHSLRSSADALDESFLSGLAALESLRRLGGMNPDNTCPRCSGRGRIFEMLAADHRAEFDCPDCLGTGLMDRAVANALSGENEQAKEENRNIVIHFKNRRYNWHSGHWF